MRATELLLGVLVFGACGRIGFGEMSTNNGSVGDATVVLPDGVDSDAVAGCSQPPPFLVYIDRIEPGNPATQILRYCAAGLPGPLDGSIRRMDDSIFAQTLGAPIETGMVDVLIGSPNCLSCFARLIANGVTADGPIEDFIGE